MVPRLHSLLLGLLVLIGASPALVGQGTDANGFFTQYLLLGPYTATGGAPGAAAIAQDYLCDGVWHEGNILPATNLLLAPPVLLAEDCGGSKTAALQSYVGDPTLAPEPRMFVADVTGDALDFNELLEPDVTNAMIYAWVWVNNNTDSDLDLQIAVSSDDSVVVDVNWQTVFAISMGRGVGGAGTIQDHAPVTLNPGPNLIQFKVFQGGGGWGLRARLESSDCPVGSKIATVPVVDGDEITVGVEPLVAEIAEATRAASAVGSSPDDVVATVELDVDPDGASYDLTERFSPEWEIRGSVPPASASGPGFLTWTGVSATSITYTLARSGVWESDDGAVRGSGSYAGGAIAVSGDTEIPGGLLPYVPEVLVTASMDLSGLGVTGCTITEEQIGGDWVTGSTGDGDDITDATIIPEEGLELLPAWSDLSQASGMTVLGPTAEAAFWTTLGDPFGSMVLNRATSDTTGLYDWQRADIYEADISTTMNVAFFYVLNTDDQPRDVVIAFGSDDSGGVRVNGSPACAMAVCRGNPGFLDKFGVTLDPGKNLVSVYTFEAGGGYNMQIRFEDVSFQPIRLPTTLDPTGYDPADHDDPACQKLSRPYVEEVLVTSSFQLEGTTGCTDLTPEIAESDWISGETGAGVEVTDGTIVPAEDMVIFPEYLGLAPYNAGLDPDMETTLASDTWWADPAEPLGGTLVRRIAAADSGTYDWQRADIYNGEIDNTVNIAWFYVVNTHAGPICAPMGVGTDDSVCVRVNGHVVFTNVACRGNPGFGDKFLAPLDPGKNLVAVYTFEEGGGYSMSIRFETEEGTPASVEWLGLEVTLDPTGYDPTAHGPRTDCVGSPYVRSGDSFGLVTQFLVPSSVFDQDLGATSLAGAVPEDYVSQAGGPPSPDRITEGAIVEAGIEAGGRITTGVRGSGCISTQLVKFNGLVDGAGSGDPGLFNGDLYYDSPDNYSSSLFFFVDNRTDDDLEAWFALASDDSASVFVNGNLVLEHIGGRGYGAANELQTFATTPAQFEPGPNLVQMSYTDGTGGSGARIGFYRDSCFTQAFRSTEIGVSVNPPDFEGSPVTAVRSVEPRRCDDTSTVTIRFSVLQGETQRAILTENLPVGTTGSSPSRGSFNAAGSVLSFDGDVSEGEEITYEIADVASDATYCLASINGAPVTGDLTFGAGCPIATGDLDASGGVPEQLVIGPIALDPTTNQGNGFCDDGGNLGTLDYLIGEVVGTACNAADIGLQTDEVDYDPILGDQILLSTEEGGGIGIRQAANPKINPRADEGILTVWRAEADANGYINYEGSRNIGAADDYIVFAVTYLENLTGDPINANLEVGSDDSIKVIVNGDVAGQHVNGICRGVPGVGAGDIVPVVLEPGLNRVLTGTVERGGGSGVRVLVLDEFLAPLTDGSVVWSRGPGTDPDFCEGGVVEPGRFERGDADASGVVNITDGIFILNFLFLGGQKPPCEDAADVDDSGRVNITDGIYTLNYLFLGGPRPPPPFETCGTDPTDDEVGCAAAHTQGNCAP